MTKEEFDNTSFKKGMEIKHNGKIKNLVGVDFQDMELAIKGNFALIWLDHAECELIK